MRLTEQDYINSGGRYIETNDPTELLIQELKRELEHIESRREYIIGEIARYEEARDISTDVA